jgi:hypothetical protein
MAIFSKDILQAAIWKVQPFLDEKQLESFAKILNKPSEVSIHSEWELIILSGFSKLGGLSHERECGGKKPDIWIALDNPDVYNLVAEIRTVSDEGLKESVVDVFSKKIQHELGKRKLKLENFSPTFKRITEKSVVEDYLNDELKTFLDLAASDKTTPRSFKNKIGSLELKFHPDSNISTQSWTITSHTKLANNPFINALERKAKQLKPATGIPKGIILCDGKSEMFIFRETSQLYLGSDDIIKGFLRRNPSINFVMTVWVDRKPIKLETPRTYKVHAHLFENTTFNQLDEKIQKLLRNIENCFPEALLPVDVALHCIRDGTILRYIGKETLQYKR